MINDIIIENIDASDANGTVDSTVNTFAGTTDSEIDNASEIANASVPANIRCAEDTGDETVASTGTEINKYYNLIAQNNGYLKELYGIRCENTDFLTGFEIGKCIFDNEYKNDNNLTIYGFLANTNKELISGFLF